MFHKSDILLIGRSREALSGVLALLEGQRLLSVRSKIFGNGHGQAWAEEIQSPDAVALCVDKNWQESLPSLLESMPPIKPPFLVLCPVSDMDLLRTAMRAGARDLLTPPYDAEDLLSRLLELAGESQAMSHASSSRLTGFINAKGGSGASFLAANVATSLVEKKARKVILVDLDFQFAGLPTYLNMKPGNGLVKALEFVEALDTAALAGYVQTNPRGLHLLSSAADGLILTDEIAEERIERLLAVLNEAYQDIIVDLPRRVDRTTGVILDHLDLVVVVAQQSVTHLHDTKRLVAIMRDYLGISTDRILLVLNRFNKKADVRREDFMNAFPGIEMETVPGDYRRVSESINLGQPVIEGAPASALGRAILNLSEKGLPMDSSQSKRAMGLLGWLGRQARN